MTEGISRIIIKWSIDTGDEICYPNGDGVTMTPTWPAPDPTDI